MQFAGFGVGDIVGQVGWILSISTPVLKIRCEFRERVAFRISVFVRRQVAGDNVRPKIITITGAWRHIKREGLEEVGASSQVMGRVGFRRSLRKKVRVVPRKVIEIRRATGGVATVAISHGVDQIAAQAHKAPVLSSQIQGDRGDRKSLLNSGIVAVVVRSSAGGADQHSRNDQGSECGPGANRLREFHMCLHPYRRRMRQETITRGSAIFLELGAAV